MEGVCLNPDEDVLRCRGCLSDFATLPDKPSWCVTEQDPPGKNRPALWIFLAFLLIAFVVCSILCYRFRRMIRKWTLIIWIIRWINNTCPCTCTRNGRIIWVHRISWFILAFIVPSMKCRVPSPAAVVHPYPIILPPPWPCFTVGFRHWGLFSSAECRQILWGPSEPNMLFWDSSNHETNSQKCIDLPTCLFAKFKRSCLFLCVLMIACAWPYYASHVLSTCSSLGCVHADPKTSSLLRLL